MGSCNRGNKDEDDHEQGIFWFLILIRSTNPNEVVSKRQLWFESEATAVERAEHTPVVCDAIIDGR